LDISVCMLVHARACIFVHTYITHTHTHTQTDMHTHVRPHTRGIPQV